jgi:hypothetical protein
MNSYKEFNLDFCFSILESEEFNINLNCIYKLESSCWVYLYEKEYHVWLDLFSKNEKLDSSCFWVFFKFKL